MRINNPGLLDSSVTTIKLADGSVTTPKLAAGAVTDGKIAGPVSVANGGTGAASLLAAGIPVLVAKANPNAMSTNSLTVLSLTPPAAGWYLFVASLKYEDTAMATGTVHIDVEVQSPDIPQGAISYEASVASQGFVELGFSTILRAATTGPMVITGVVSSGTTTGDFWGQGAIFRVG